MEFSGKQRSEEMWVEKQGKRSYVEAVIGASEERWKGLSIKTKQHVLPWMEKSVVGKLRDVMDIDQLWEEVVKGGLNMVRLRALRDNLVLLTPREGENMENIIKRNSEWFDSVFESLKPWSVSSGPSHKSVWVRCYGLPLSF